MHLRIMPERLEVPHTFHPVEDGFLIDDTALFKRGFHAEPFPDQITQHLDLYLTHQLGMNLVQLLSPDQMKLRFLFFKLT